MREDLYFKEWLEEKMKDPAFRAEWEKWKGGITDLLVTEEVAHSPELDSK